MISKNKFLIIVDFIVFLLIILILSIFIKISASEAWPRARDAMRRNDLAAMSKAIENYQKFNNNLAPFVNQNNKREQEKNYLLLENLLVPRYIEYLPKDTLMSKAPQAYGYLAMQQEKNQIAQNAKTAKNFRLGAYSENTSNNFHFYDLSVTPMKGNIYYP